jgi:hypothetical protein
LSFFTKYGILVEASETGVVLPDMKDLPFYEVVMEKKDNNGYLVTGNLKHFPHENFIVTARQMLALNAYLVEIGKLDSSVYTSSVLAGTSVSKVDLSSASNFKKNFLNNIKEMMIMQYNAHNLDGYAQCRNILGVYNLFMGIA